MSYAEEDDLLLHVPLPASVDPKKYLQDATDEIDAALGARYSTPFDLSDTSSIQRHSRLLIKRICNHLATGRLILALAIPGEDDRPNAYGLSLLKGALETLAALGAGTVLLDVEPAPGDVEPVDSTTPLIFNEDDESSVEAFYDRVVNPSYRGYDAEGERSYPGLAGFVR